MNPMAGQLLVAPTFVLTGCAGRRLSLVAPDDPADAPNPSKGRSMTVPNLGLASTLTCLESRSSSMQARAWMVSLGQPGRLQGVAGLLNDPAQRQTGKSKAGKHRWSLTAVEVTVTHPANGVQAGMLTGIACWADSPSAYTPALTRLPHLI